MTDALARVGFLLTALLPIGRLEAPDLDHPARAERLDILGLEVSVERALIERFDQACGFLSCSPLPKATAILRCCSRVIFSFIVVGAW
jgi:hypothetical protein